MKKNEQILLIVGAIAVLWFLNKDDKDDKKRGGDS